jgi:hypothetical protein
LRMNHVSSDLGITCDSIRSQLALAGDGNENKLRLGLTIKLAEFANVHRRLFNGYSTTCLEPI